MNNYILQVTYAIILLLLTIFYLAFEQNRISYYVLVMISLFSIYFITISIRHKSFIYEYGFIQILLFLSIIFFTYRTMYGSQQRTLFYILIILFLTLTCTLEIIKNNNYSYYKKIANELIQNCDKTVYELHTGWNEYRISDIFTIGLSLKIQGVKNYHLEHFPDSIASAYIRSTNKTSDYNVLQKCISLYKNNNNSMTTPDKNTYVIHIRVGDVIDGQSEDVATILSRPIYYSFYSNTPFNFFNNHFNTYTKNINYYESKLKVLQSYPIKKIIIVAGSHIFSNYDKSSLYINCIALYFRNSGYDVSLRLGHNSDQDLYFMSHASYFTPSGGGFSSIVSTLIKEKGGIII